MFNGTGVDVYVADTGIDTLHQEFATPTSRVVENIFNAFGSVTTDTDGHSHGTHCSGTVGGNTIGVSSGANIFGVKVLSNSGSGSDENIAEGLEYIIEYASNRTNPAVVSMSLCGGCYERSCSEDPYNVFTLALQAVMDEGIPIIAAAGNDNIDACFYAPAGIPGIITIGASDINDDEASFSSYGPCVDLYAPGVDINSACAESSCGDETSYVEYSGTSMATPHVAGVAAQILQNNPDASIEELRESLQCSGVASTIDMLDILHVSYTPNILLQVPSSSSLDTCNRGAGCPDDCSGEGYCDDSYNRTEAVCMCISPATNLFEDSCSEWYFGLETNETEVPSCYMSDANVSVTMFSSTVGWSSGYGWLGSAWSIFNSSDVTMSPMATATLGFYEPSSLETTVDVCLMENTCYKFGTSSGEYHFLTEWEVCGVAGGELFTGDLCIDASGDCSLTCESDASMIEVWDATPDPSGYTISSLFAVDAETSQWTNSVKLGGNNSYDGVKSMCLKKDRCYGFHTEIAYDDAFFSIPACGLEDVSTSLAPYYQVCVDSAGSCNSTFSSGCSASESPLSVNLYDTWGDGWDGGVLNVINSDGSTHSSFTLASGSYVLEIACLEEGNYTLTFDQPTSWAKEMAWEVCGRSGGAAELLKGTLVIDSSLDCHWECEGGDMVSIVGDPSYSGISIFYDGEFQAVTSQGEVIAQDYVNDFNYQNQTICMEHGSCAKIKVDYVCSFTSISSLSVDSYKAALSPSKTASFGSIQKEKKAPSDLSKAVEDRRLRQEAADQRRLAANTVELCDISIEPCSSDYVCLSSDNTCTFSEIDGDSAEMTRVSIATFLATLFVGALLFLGA